MVKYKGMECYMGIYMSVDGITKLWLIIKKLIPIIETHINLCLQYKNLSDVVENEDLKNRFLSFSHINFNESETWKEIIKQITHTSAEWVVKMLEANMMEVVKCLNVKNVEK